MNLPHRIVFSFILLTSTSYLAFANDSIRFEGCDRLQQASLRRQMNLANKRITRLLDSRVGLRSYDINRVHEVFLSRLPGPLEVNPHPEGTGERYFKAILEMNRGFLHIQFALNNRPLIFKCHPAKPPWPYVNKTCLDVSVEAFVETEKGAPLDNRLHFCLKHFKNSDEGATSTMVHELSHLVLNTPSDHPAVKLLDIRTFKNFALDAYRYGELVSSDLEEALKWSFWRYFWYQPRN